MAVFRKRHTVKLLISARVAINFRRELDPAATGGRRLLEVLRYFLTSARAVKHFRHALDPDPISCRLLSEDRWLLEVLRYLRERNEKKNADILKKVIV